MQQVHFGAVAKTTDTAVGTCSILYYTIHVLLREQNSVHAHWASSDCTLNWKGNIMFGVYYVHMRNQTYIWQM
jgi:hypothetical protein